MISYHILSLLHVFVCGFTKCFFFMALQFFYPAEVAANLSCLLVFTLFLLSGLGLNKTMGMGGFCIFLRLPLD